MNIDELWNKYSATSHIKNCKLMNKKMFTRAIAEIISLPVEAPVSQENGGFNIHTSKEEYEEDGETKICFIAHSTFLGKYSCHAEGETRLEAVKKYLEESLEFIKFLETEGHGEKLNKELDITERKW